MVKTNLQRFSPYVALNERKNSLGCEENVHRALHQTPAISSFRSHQLFIVMVSVTLAEASNTNYTIQRILPTLVLTRAVQCCMQSCRPAGVNKPLPAPLTLPRT
jgi:hypothetical protein